MSLFLNVVIFGVYALASGTGLLVLKIAMTENPPELSKIFSLLLNVKFLAGGFLYVIGFISWMFILSKFKLNVAFPIAISLFFIVSSLGSYFFLKESFDLRNLIGMLLCLSGIVLISIK
jgi:drug/metabolite transporter (DMT)-like permease